MKIASSLAASTKYSNVNGLMVRGNYLERSDLIPGPSMPTICLLQLPYFAEAVGRRTGRSVDGM